MAALAYRVHNANMQITTPALYFQGLPRQSVDCKEVIAASFELKEGEELLSLSELVKLYPCPEIKRDDTKDD